MTSKNNIKKLKVHDIRRLFELNVHGSASKKFSCLYCNHEFKEDNDRAIRLSEVQKHYVKEHDINANNNL